MTAVPGIGSAESTMTLAVALPAASRVVRNAFPSFPVSCTEISAPATVAVATLGSDDSTPPAATSAGAPDTLRARAMVRAPSVRGLVTTVPLERMNLPGPAGASEPRDFTPNDLFGRSASRRATISWSSPTTMT
ncbi:MAG: hypothetical protein HOO96_21185 [Polyangiaceae bacterium]|nr:hypothetical protein [Polyangiaceae bacterium]